MKQWFILHTYSGHEKKVRDSLKARVARHGSASRDYAKCWCRRKRSSRCAATSGSSRRACSIPGYVLVADRLRRARAHSRQRVSHDQVDAEGDRLCRRPNPTPLTPQEVDQIVHQQAEAAEKPKPKFSYAAGETVRIKSGPFQSFTGKVEEVNEDKSTLKVTVTIFGRSTPVELNFLDVEKVTFAEEE